MQLSLARHKAAFQYPLGHAPRTAVLVPWFQRTWVDRGWNLAGLRSRDVVRAFADGWSPEAAQFAPGAVAGTRDQLLELAAADAPRLTHALVALVRPGEALLTPAERDRLWRAFRVPLFEQIIAEDGRVLASECEAHDGLHVEEAAEESGGWKQVATAYMFELQQCPCRRGSPRLFSPRPVERAAAAYAR